MNINDIPKKRDVEAMTNPKTQVSAEEFNTVVDATRGSVNSVGIGDGKALCLHIGTHGTEAHEVEVPNATEERAGAMGAEDKVLMRDLKAAVTENNLALYPLSMEVGGVENPYEAGKDNAIRLTITARHKGKVVTGDVRYLLDGEAVNKQHTITVRESKETDVRVEYSGYQLLGEVQHLSASKTVKVVCVPPCWIGGSAEASMSGKDLSAMGLTKHVKESPAGEYTIVLNTDGYLWLCVPYEMQIGKVTMSGFDVPVSESLSATPGGEVYRCYQSNELVRGAYTIVIS